MKPFSDYEEMMTTPTVEELRNSAKEEIKRRIPCTRYLKKSKDRMYICPRCGSGTGENKTGALKYYDDTNLCFCHACMKKGSKDSIDVIELHMTEKGLDYNGALEELAAELNLPLTPDEYREQSTRRPRIDENAPKSNETGLSDNLSTKTAKTAQTASNASTEARDFSGYYKLCTEYLQGDKGQEGRDYLTSRGISPELAAKYGIGYDPKADPANAAGKFVGDKPHPVKRIILPTSKSHYVGRRIDGIKKFDKMNPQGASPDIFNHASLKAGNVVFVTEGIFDALTVMECIQREGVEAVALNSTSNREMLVQRLKESEPENREGLQIILCGDNDDSGRTMNKDLSKELGELGVKHLIANICDGYKDANEALTNGGREAMTEAIEKAIKDVEQVEVANKEKSGDAAEISEDDSPLIGNESQNGDALDQFFENIQKKSAMPIRTGLKWYDDLLGGGIKRQTLTVVIAAPSAGKTTLCQQIAECMAARGQEVCYLNLEMSNYQMIAKALSSRMAAKVAEDARATGKTRVDNSKRMETDEILQGYKWTDAQRETVKQAIEEYRQNGAANIVYAKDGSSASLISLIKYMEEIGEEAKAKGKQAPAIVLDYLHLLTADKVIDEKSLIKQAVTELKKYAIKYDTFVIAISASNRDANKQGKLDLFSARDSSNIEYTGDYVLTLNYKDIVDGKVSSSNDYELNKIKRQPNISMWLQVEKNRFGARAQGVQIIFNPAYNRFYGKDDFIPAEGEDNPFEKGEAESENILEQVNNPNIATF